MKIKILKEQTPQQAAPAQPAAPAAAAPAADPKALEKEKQEFVKILNGTIQALQQISKGLATPTPAAPPATAKAAPAPQQPAQPAKA